MSTTANGHNPFLNRLQRSVAIARDTVRPAINKWRVCISTLQDETLLHRFGPASPGGGLRSSSALLSIITHHHHHQQQQQHHHHYHHRINSPKPARVVASLQHRLLLFLDSGRLESSHYFLGLLLKLSAVKSSPLSSSSSYTIYVTLSLRHSFCAVLATTTPIRWQQSQYGAHTVRTKS